MSTFVRTASGATYEFSDDYTLFRRTSTDAPLRKDGEWLKCEVIEPVVGEDMHLRIHGIVVAPGFTYRRTTPVVAIWEG
ncbi:MAG: hypothetical protein RBS17_07490 [Coriobacteriia bacterium]|nr:hypothetical protein [Coriobacteriia bacterium]